MIEGHCHCGAVGWRYRDAPESATACNCTSCRRYGALWIYGHEHGGIEVTGSTTAYSHGDRSLAFHFCPACGSVGYWRALALGPDGRRRIAVNVRWAAPEAVGHLPIRHFDGLGAFEDLPRDGRCVADLWF